MKIPKTQHYVPQFILKQFVTTNDQVWVFDKRTGKKFKTNLKNVACEKGFYDFEFSDHRLTLEISLSEVDDQASRVIKKITRNQSLAVMSEREKHCLAQFIAIQFVRTRQSRDIFKDVNMLMVQAFLDHGIKKEDIEGYEEPNETNIKLSHMSFIECYKEFAPYIFNKTWVLLSTAKRNPFYISDNPITLQNMFTSEFRGNLGLAVKGIEIYFPVSSTLSLAMWCTTHEDTIKEAYKEYEYLYKTNPSLAKLVLSDPYIVEQLIKGIDTGEPIVSAQENVINHNSLQVIHSSRFIYSSTEDFSLAEEMIRNHPELCEGTRLRVN